MNCLVRGGAGFIGSHLVELLLDRDNFVTVLDDFSTGSIDNLKHLVDNEILLIEKGSVLDKAALWWLTNSCDEIYHLAAVVGVMEYLKHPLKTMKTNIEGTENVLEVARERNAKVLIMSSSEVYGYGGRGLRETDPGTIGSPVKSFRWGYGLSKSVDEFLALGYRNEYDMSLVVVRPFNVVGPRQTGFYGMVVPRFIEQAMAGKPITVFGTGEQTRSFIYVKTFVQVLYELMYTAEAQGRVINVAGPEEISIWKLAETVKEVTGSDSEIVLVPYEEAYGTDMFEDALKRSADLTVLESILGWRPDGTVKEIIQRIVEEK